MNKKIDVHKRKFHKTQISYCKDIHIFSPKQGYTSNYCREWQLFYEKNLREQKRK